MNIDKLKDDFKFGFILTDAKLCKNLPNFQHEYNFWATIANNNTLANYASQIFLDTLRKNSHYADQLIQYRNRYCLHFDWSLFISDNSNFIVTANKKLKDRDQYFTHENFKYVQCKKYDDDLQFNNKEYDLLGDIHWFCHNVLFPMMEKYVEYEINVTHLLITFVQNICITDYDLVNQIIEKAIDFFIKRYNNLLISKEYTTCDSSIIPDSLLEDINYNIFWMNVTEHFVFKKKWLSKYINYIPNMYCLCNLMYLHKGFEYLKIQYPEVRIFFKEYYLIKNRFYKIDRSPYNYSYSYNESDQYVYVDNKDSSNQHIHCFYRLNKSIVTGQIFSVPKLKSQQDFYKNVYLYFGLAADANHHWISPYFNKNKCFKHCKIEDIIQKYIEFKNEKSVL